MIMHTIYTLKFFDRMTIIRPKGTLFLHEGDSLPWLEYDVTSILLCDYDLHTT
jgi:hypothetical protein